MIPELEVTYVAVIDAFTVQLLAVGETYIPDNVVIIDLDGKKWEIFSSVVDKGSICAEAIEELEETPGEGWTAAGEFYERFFEQCQVVFTYPHESHGLVIPIKCCSTDCTNSSQREVDYFETPVWKKLITQINKTAAWKDLKASQGLPEFKMVADTATHINDMCPECASLGLQVFSPTHRKFGKSLATLVTKYLQEPS
jgi:hypothetical protein